MKKNLGICVMCGINEAVHIHHRDKDRKNNHPSNLFKVCRYCHTMDDGWSDEIGAWDTFSYITRKTNNSHNGKLKYAGHLDRYKDFERDSGMPEDLIY